MKTAGAFPRFSSARPPGLFRRLMVSFAVLVTVVAGAYGTALFGTTEWVENRLIAGMMADDAETAVSDVPAGFVLPRSDARRIYGPPPYEPVPDSLRAVPEGFSEVTGGEALFVYRTDAAGQSYVFVRPQKGFDALEHTLRVMAVLSVLLVSVLAMIVSRLLSGQVIRPVSALSRAVQEASGSNTCRPLARDTDDEVGELVSASDTALRRLHEALDRERRFTADISHELYTPLTVIGTSVELLTLTPLTPEQQRHADKILRAYAAMQEQLKLFLTLARGEQAGFSGEPVPAGGILSQQCDFWAPYAEEKGVRLAFLREENCTAVCQGVMLTSVAGNLIKEAVVGHPGGRVTVRLMADGFSVETAEGTGTPDDVPVLEDLRTGQAIVERVCRRMGWKVERRVGVTVVRLVSARTAFALREDENPSAVSG